MNEVKKDSLGEKEAWAKWEKGYMDRTHKFKGTKFEKPISAEENRKEMESERGEFKYDSGTGTIRLRKTDDADQPIEMRSPIKEVDWKRKLDSVNTNKYYHQQNKLIKRKKDKGQDTKEVENSINNLLRSDLGKYVNKEAQNDLNKKSPLDMMMPGRSPLNKEGKKDACYHKVKGRVKVWPSAYASGQLVQCRKAGASNWGTKSKK